jgi:hypothetical protein
MARMGRFAPPLLILLIALAGCGDGDSAADPEQTPAERGSQEIAPPDAGTARGHGADAPGRVTVPEADRTAPRAILRLGATEAVSGSAAPAPVELDSTTLRVEATGRDPQGMTRIRVSIEAQLTCAGERVPLIRYFPPPKTERPTIPPGRQAPTEISRRAGLDLARGRCPADSVETIEGRAWADATSAHETEASSAPIAFRYES